MTMMGQPASASNFFTKAINFPEFILSWITLKRMSPPGLTAEISFKVKRSPLSSTTGVCPIGARCSHDGDHCAPPIHRRSKSPPPCAAPEPATLETSYCGNAPIPADPAYRSDRLAAAGSSPYTAKGGRPRFYSILPPSLSSTLFERCCASTDRKPTETALDLPR